MIQSSLKLVIEREAIMKLGVRIIKSQSFIWTSVDQGMILKTSPL